MIAEVCIEYEEEGWFQAVLGKDCVDHPKDIGALTMAAIGVDIWPLKSLHELDEDWLFTAVEFLHLRAAKPTASYLHAWNQCGIHVTSADRRAGRAAFRERLNSLLARSETPYELRDNGEIWSVAPTGLEDLVVEEIGDPSVDDRVASANARYRRHGSSDEERRQAVRDLADVLEYLRKSVGTGLPSKDEGYLFDIANKFGIRHHNREQKTKYDRGIWLDWIFYAYLNAIALAMRILARAEGD